MSIAAGCVLAEDRFDADERMREFAGQAAGAGAIASFTGLARPAGKAGEPVNGLFLQHHPSLTLISMNEIERSAKARFAVDHLLIIHRYGWVPVGEPIVLVAAASAHRREALQAVDYAMDRLKTDAVFWKREDGDGKSQWIEPTNRDHKDRARWDGDRSAGATS